MASKRRYIDTTEVGSRPLKLILKTKLLTLTGSWHLEDEVLGNVLDISGLPITYDYLVNIDGHNFLIYPDDICILAKIEANPPILEKETLHVRLITPEGEIRQVQLNPQLSCHPIEEQTRVYEIEDIMAARQELEEEHRRLNEAQAIGHIGNFEWDATSDRFYWSDQMFRIHQLEPQSQEITLEDSIRLIHPDDRKWVRQKIMHARETPSAENIIHRLLLKDGSVKYVNSHFESFADEQGQVTRINGTVRDITETKKAEDLLQKHLQILKQTEEAAEIGSWELDRETDKFSWSDGMYRIFELEKGTSVSPEIYLEAAVKADDPIARKIVDIFRNHPQAFEETIRIRIREKTKTLKIKGAVLKNDNGDPVKVVGIDMDVSSIVESGQALKEQEHFISNVVKTIPDVISVINLATRRIEYINREPLSALRRHDLPQIEADPRLEMVHHDDVSALKDYFRKFESLSDDIVNTVEYRARAHHGEWEWFRSHGKVFSRSEDGGATHCVNVVQNITEAKKSQNEIIQMKEALARQAQSKYEELFRSIDQGFAILQLIYDKSGDPNDYVIQQTNPALERITGFKNITGKRLREILADPPEDWFRTFGKIVQTQRPLRFTVKAEELGGAWFDIHAFPTGQPQSHKVAVLFNDITDRIITEKNLREKQLKLQIAQRAGRVGIWSYSFRSQQGIATKEWMDLLGYPESGENWSLDEFLSLVDHQDADVIRSAFEDAKKRKSIDLEFRIHHTTRGLQWFVMRGSYIISQNEAEDALMGSIIDITDRKAFEEQKEQFIGIASHELKTPVTSIKAYAEILREVYSQKGETLHATMMERMVSQVDRLTKLINDLLDTTKITGGGLLLEPEKFDINELIFQRVEEMQRTTNHRLTIKPDNLPLLLADKDRISQVLTNLISNAIKYSPQGSEVMITTEKKGNDIIVRVRDHGIGLPEEASLKVFERFYRVNNENINTVTGLGLGLFIASEIIRKHHGTMGVKSKKGEGSEFYFTLPLGSDDTPITEVDT